MITLVFCFHTFFLNLYCMLTYLFGRTKYSEADGVTSVVYLYNLISIIVPIVIKMTSKFSEDLLMHYVRDHDYLYDICSKGYRDKVRREKAWIDIAAKFIDSDVPPHVHFSGEDSFGNDNDIVVRAADDGKLTVHLGFLKLQHKYEVQVTVPRLGGSGAKLQEYLPSGIPSLYIQLVSLSQEDSTVHLTVHLTTHKEKLQKEEICLQAVGEDCPIHITFMARVLGKNKGTPLLKNGVKCIAVMQEDESEASDWQGF